MICKHPIPPFLAPLFIQPCQKNSTHEYNPSPLPRMKINDAYGSQLKIAHQSEGPRAQKKMPRKIENTVLSCPIILKAHIQPVSKSTISNACYDLIAKKKGSSPSCHTSRPKPPGPLCLIRRVFFHGSLHRVFHTPVISQTLHPNTRSAKRHPSWRCHLFLLLSRQGLATIGPSCDVLGY